jgi:hypothetical protein
MRDRSFLTIFAHLLSMTCIFEVGAFGDWQGIHISPQQHSRTSPIMQNCNQSMPANSSSNVKITAQPLEMPDNQ